MSGLGLALVAAAASRWGYTATGSGRTVWAEAPSPVAVTNDSPTITRQPWFAGDRSWPDGHGAA